MARSPAPRPSKPPPKAPADDRKARLKSAAEVAKLLGAGRNTVQRWIDAGCPVVSKPVTPGDGDRYVLDLGEVVEWRIATEVAAARKASARPARMAGDHDEDEDVASDLLKDPEKRMKVARLAVQLLSDQKRIVLTDDVEALFERAMGLIRQAVMAMPNRLIRFVPGLGVAETREFHTKVSSAAADTLEDVDKLVRTFVAEARKAQEEAGR
ncbi:hypothetical protein [Methylobacterium sp.]|uniref:hypothetical protein n=1 Tax=Methylobacterium sp. TaxID=409 RepID=UPI003B02A73D